MNTSKYQTEHHDWSILDCTLRDGGYYTNWDFDDALVGDYLSAMSQMPISMVELGYVSEPEEGYAGQYFYLTKNKLMKLREMAPKAPPFAIMLNTKSCVPDRMHLLLDGLQGVVDTVRMASDPAQHAHSLAVATVVKALGFKVNLNLMYLSNNWNNEEFFETLIQFKDVVGTIALVDSYGSCYPHQVATAISHASKVWPGEIGFHGHDNITLSFANAIVAIENGATVIDSTVLGIGRGAGNLRTEILALYFQKIFGEAVNLLPLTGLFDELNAMKANFRWGAELPYIVSGFANLPQKDVMSWMATRRYSTRTIVAALQGEEQASGPRSDFAKLDGSFRLKGKTAPECIIIGGGETAAYHAKTIIDYAKRSGALLIHSSTRSIRSYEKADVPQLLCIVGDEVSKLDEGMVKSLASKMLALVVEEGCEIHSGLDAQSFDNIFCVTPIVAKEQNLIGPFSGATPLGTAFGITLKLGSSSVYLAGFDGYEETSSKGAELQKETQGVLDSFVEKHPGVHLASVTPSQYHVAQESIYSRLSSLDFNVIDV